MSDNRKHYIYKLATNFIRIPVSFILQAIFPRILTPSAYGNFDFLTDSATKFIGFFESGTSIAFYTKLSSNSKDRKLVKFYWRLVASISVIYFLFVCLSGICGFYQAIWPKQDNFTLIFLSGIWGIVTYFSNTAYKMLDAYHITVKAERFRMLQLVVSLLFFAVLFYSRGTIDVNVFFYIQIAFLLLLFLGSIFILKRFGHAVYPAETLTKEDVKTYGNFFWKFSSPLFLYALFGLIAAVGDRWILQMFGGSIQQAYFGLSLKAGGLVFIFTSAMIPLLMRELSKLFGESDLERIRDLFLKNIRILIFIASVLAIMLASNAEFVVDILGGKKYHEAATLVAIMSFYPIHQTLGQINSSLFYATSRTKEYTQIGLTGMPFGLLLSFVLIAPRKYFGFELGGIGLAFQMIATQLIVQNILLYFNCKYLKCRFGKLVLFQCLLFVYLGGIGYLLKSLIGQLQVSLFVGAIIFGAIFSIAAIGLILVKPSVLGFNKLGEVWKIKKRRS
jgi:O-antigen/teichoic acid export membrane protein